MGDRLIDELGDKTPLQAANIPVLDRLAEEGQCGVADPVKRGIVATTVLGTLAILGYDPLKHSIARGVIEAYGCEMEIMPGDVAFRGNWATLDNHGKIIDRRAGRIREGTKELASSLNAIKIEDVSVEVGVGTEHRIAVVLRGEGDGEDGTTLYFSSSLSDLFGWIPQWSWSGGLIHVRGTPSSEPLAEVTVDALRGDETLTLSTTVCASQQLQR